MPEEKQSTPTSFVLDKHGREILPGDTLKVFHFFGARKKRHYMYKYVRNVYAHEHWNGVDALVISHLNLRDEAYLELRMGQQLIDHEIVQGYGEDGTCFNERPKRKAVKVTFHANPYDQ